MGLAPSAIKSEKVQLGGEAAIFTVTVQKQGFFDFFSWVVPIWSNQQNFRFFNLVYLERWNSVLKILVYESEQQPQQQ